MKYKTAFRLALRAMGVFLVAHGVPDAIQAVVWALEYSATLMSLYAFGMIGAAAAKVCIGVYLFFGARWVVDLAIPSNRPYCHECGYELTGLPTCGSCPECGVPFAREPSGVLADVGRTDQNPER